MTADISKAAALIRRDCPRKAGIDIATDDRADTTVRK
jgi:hypothetical protein